MSKDRDDDSDKLNFGDDRIDYRLMYPVSGRTRRNSLGEIRKPKPRRERQRPAFALDEPPKRPKLPETRVKFETELGGPRSLIDLTYEVMCEDIDRSVDTVHALLEANGYQTSAQTVSKIMQDMRRAIRAAERVLFVKVLDDRWHEQHNF